MHTRRDFFYVSHSFEWEVNGEIFQVGFCGGVSHVIREECWCWMECDPSVYLDVEAWIIMFDCPHLPI